MSNINNGFLKGICYDAFPHGYNLDNNTCIWFISDIAQHNMAPLWGKSFIPVDGPDKDHNFSAGIKFDL